MFRQIFLVCLVVYVTIALAEAKTNRSNLRDILQSPHVNDSNPSPRMKHVQETQRCRFDANNVDSIMLDSCLANNCISPTFSATCSISNSEAECVYKYDSVDDSDLPFCVWKTCFGGGYWINCNSNPSPRMKHVQETQRCRFDANNVDSIMLDSCLANNCISPTFSATCSISNSEAECVYKYDSVDDSDLPFCVWKTCFGGGYWINCTL